MSSTSHLSSDASPSLPSPDETDGADMARLTRGHDAALNDLMERHAASLFRFLCRMLGNADDANDLAQETFVRVFRNRASFRPGQRFTTWMYTIAANLARNQLRWRERHPHVALEATLDDESPSLRDSLPDWQPDAPDQIAAEERLKAIQAAVTELPEELRTPLILAEYEDRSQKEIAEVLSCSVKAVETRIYRARQQLRARLKGFL